MQWKNSAHYNILRFWVTNFFPPKLPYKQLSHLLSVYSSAVCPMARESIKVTIRFWHFFCLKQTGKLQFSSCIVISAFDLLFFALKRTFGNQKKKLHCAQFINTLFHIFAVLKDPFSPTQLIWTKYSAFGSHFSFVQSIYPFPNIIFRSENSFSPPFLPPPPSSRRPHHKRSHFSHLHFMVLFGLEFSNSNPTPSTIV